MNSKDNFAVRFKEAFNHARNKDIAEQLGVSKATITLYTSGHLPPSETLLTIADKTGCNLHWLMTGQGSKWMHSTDGPYEKKANIIATYHAAGGTGKSVAATFLAMSLARRNYRTLLVETSREETLSYYLYPRPWAIVPSSATYSSTSWDKLDKRFFETPISGLDLYTSSNITHGRLIQLGVHNFSVVPSEVLRKYSFIIVDTQSELLEAPDLLIARLIMSSKVLIPCDAKRYNSGIEDCFSFLQHTQEQSDEIEVFGAFANMAETNSRNTRRVISEMHQLLPGRALETVIHRDIKFSRCVFNNLGVHTLSSRAMIVKEHDQLAEEVILRTETNRR